MIIIIIIIIIIMITTTIIMMIITKQDLVLDAQKEKQLNLFATFASITKVPT